MTDFRETLYTIDNRGNRKWVYPHVINGSLRVKRRAVISALIGFYILMPWIGIKGHQAIHLDLLRRQFTFFGTTFHASETFYIFLILGLLGFALFFFTSVFGRIWCGWACPQTVFLEFVFRPIERLIEGDAVKRRRLDNAPWNFNKILKKSIKLVVFAVISWVLASTFLAYFVGRAELLNMISQSPFANLPLFIFTVLFMGVVLFEFGWFREQFCTVLCPYARLQSVLLDGDSLAVSYDFQRGEPRGKKNNGDCIDCGQCVRVCPTGIDIRNGLQLECVQCTACIDACNDIMKKIDKPLGLIRYATENTLRGGGVKILRLRVVTYGVITVMYTVALVGLLHDRKMAEYQFIRAAHDSPFTLTDFATVINHYTLRIRSRSKSIELFRVTNPSNPEVSVTVPIDPYPVSPLGEGELPVFFKFPKQLLKEGKGSVQVDVELNDQKLGTTTVPLIGPDI